MGSLLVRWAEANDYISFVLSHSEYFDFEVEDEALIFERNWLVRQNGSWFDVWVYFRVHLYAHVALVVESSGVPLIARMALRRLRGGVLRHGASTRIFCVLVGLYLEIQ